MSSRGVITDAEFIPLEVWARSIGQTARWARHHIHTGEIVAVRIGSRYFMTTATIAETEQRTKVAAGAASAGQPASSPADTDEGWGLVTRLSRPGRSA